MSFFADARQNVSYTFMDEQGNSLPTDSRFNKYSIQSSNRETQHYNYPPDDVKEWQLKLLYGGKGTPNRYNPVTADNVTRNLSNYDLDHLINHSGSVMNNRDNYVFSFDKQSLLHQEHSLHQWEPNPHNNSLSFIGFMPYYQKYRPSLNSRHDRDRSHKLWQTKRSPREVYHYGHQKRRHSRYISGVPLGSKLGSHHNDLSSASINWVEEPSQSFMFSNNTGGVLNCRAVSTEGDVRIDWLHENGRPLLQVSHHMLTELHSFHCIFAL